MSAEIQLRARDGSLRAVVLVDEADFVWLNQWRWCLSRHGTRKPHHKPQLKAVRNVILPDGRHTMLSMHRQIAGFPVSAVDHINGNPLDNRRTNLRLVTPSQNQQNRHGVRVDSTTNLRGVSFDARRQRFRAYAQLHGKFHHIGYFLTAEQAGQAASNWRQKHMTHSDGDL